MGLFWRRRREPAYFEDSRVAPQFANIGLEGTAAPLANRLAPGEAFTPTQPKTGRRRLIGREAELRRILQTLQEDRAHVVLYSERGRGKTSLTNMVVEALRRADTMVARHTCEAGTTFNDLMRGLLRDLPSSLLAARVGSDELIPGGGPHGDNDEDGCVAALPPGDLRPRDIVMMPQRLNCRNLVCVIDEFDRVMDPSTRIRLADTIKQLSDRDVPLLFVIVGVSENLEQILGQHPSIQRAVLGVHLSLFADRDVAQLITRGGRETGLQFPPATIARITVLARGMPYMAQLLGLRLAQAARERGDDVVLEDDFEEAVERLLADAAPRVVALYAELTKHGRDADMVLALRRIASAPQDAWGRLLVMEAADGSATVGGRTVPASCWERLQAAKVLQPTMIDSDQFMFAERGLMHHALLLAARDVAVPEMRQISESAETDANDPGAEDLGIRGLDMPERHRTPADLTAAHVRPASLSRG